jgi:5-formyltetrahydrofolate cyclo-ligase
VDLFFSLSSRGQRIVYPRIAPEGAEGLVFHLVDNIELLTDGLFGIKEPPEGTEVVPLLQVEAVMVPGIVFDENGYRLGFGKGMYDQALLGCSALKVGLAYEFQVVSRLDIESHDIPCDMVISERRIIESNG